MLGSGQTRRVRTPPCESGGNSSVAEIGRGCRRSRKSYSYRQPWDRISTSSASQVAMVASGTSTSGMLPFSCGLNQSLTSHRISCIRPLCGCTRRQQASISPPLARRRRCPPKARALEGDRARDGNGDSLDARSDLCWPPAMARLAHRGSTGRRRIRIAVSVRTTIAPASKSAVTAARLSRTIETCAVARRPARRRISRTDGFSARC